MPRRILPLLLAILPLLPAGCSGKKNVAHEEQQHLSTLVRAYGFYIRSHRGERPASMAALKEFVKKMTPEELASANLEADQVDSMFTSTRDGQEYVLRTVAGPTGPPGAGSGVPGAGGAQTVILYEKEGKNGKRLVAYEFMKVEEVDEEKFKQLVPEAK